MEDLTSGMEYLELPPMEYQEERRDAEMTHIFTYPRSEPKRMRLSKTKNGQTNPNKIVGRKRRPDQLWKAQGQAVRVDNEKRSGLGAKVWNGVVQASSVCRVPNLQGREKRDSQIQSLLESTTQTTFGMDESPRKFNYNSHKRKWTED